MGNNLNTPYDDAFRTMIEKCDDIVLPVLNYMFDEHYTGKEKIIRGSNEEFAVLSGSDFMKRITDSQLL